MSQEPSAVEPHAKAAPDAPREPIHTERVDPVATLIAGEASRHRTATEFVEATLRKGILSGALPAGMPLRQEDLATQFGLSRMPIREALRQLEAQALIDFAPHKGAVVTEISLSDALDTYVIRRALETAALELSIPHLTAEDLRRARDLIQDLDAETEPQRLGELNRRFHMSLYMRAGRPKLLTLLEAQFVSYDRYLRFHLSAYGRAHMAQDDHRALVDAAEAGDVATAVGVLHRHIDTAAAAITRFFQAREDEGVTAKP